MKETFIVSGIALFFDKKDTDRLLFPVRVLGSFVRFGELQIWRTLTFQEGYSITGMPALSFGSQTSQVGLS